MADRRDCHMFLPSFGQLNARQMHTTLHTLHCTALHCTALHCTALHCTALHCTALHCTALHCTALHCTALHCTALHCTACTALHCTALHYTTLHHTIHYKWWEEIRNVLLVTITHVCNDYILTVIIVYNQ